MHKKLAGYTLLSFLSFCTFTLLFHAAAHAQSGDFVSPQVQVTQPAPSPTMYVKAQALPTPELLNKQPDQPLPTPTIYIAPAKEVAAASGKKDSAVKNEAPRQELVTPTVEPTATPTPTETPAPTPVPTTSSATDLDSLFSKYSGEYSVDIELLKKIAKCESGFNPNSNNSGLYLGMFQFSSSTWIANRTRMGMDTNPDLRTNAEEAIRTAAFLISRGGRNAWPNCN